MPAIVDFETIPQLFLGLMQRHHGQGRTVLRYKDKRRKEWVDISWEELKSTVESFAGFMLKAGIVAGDRVAVLSENRPEWAVADMATQFIGGVNVALYTSLPASQVGYIVKDSGARLLVVSSSMQLRKAEEIFDSCPELKSIVTLSELRKEHPDYVTSWDTALAEGRAHWDEAELDLAQTSAAITPESLSALIYTSGTTGNPKGVMLTHGNFCENTISALSRVPFGPEDHHLSFLPLCHSFERTAGYTAVLACGAKISYAESIEAVSKNLIEVKPTVMISVPRLFERVYNVIAKSVAEGPPVKKKIFDWSISTGMAAANRRRTGSSIGPLLGFKHALANKLVFDKLHQRLGGNLRFAVSGGAALPRAIGEFFDAAGVKLIEGYGLTETSPVLSVNPLEAPRYGTVGYILNGIHVGILRIADGEILGVLSGEDYPSDLTTEEGEIVVKGPNVMKGYWGDDEATRQAIDDAGWYHTGDVGRFDQGYLQITDRIKHMIVSKGGKNIYPGPIEDSFRTIDCIDQIVVVGEGREFLSALVLPEMDRVRAFADEKGVSGSDSELREHETVRALFKSIFRSYSKKAAAHEKIRDFRLISEPFSIDEGTLTPTLKPRRKAIEAMYADLIDEMYAEIV